MAGLSEPESPLVAKLIPLVMLIAALGVTAFMAVAFRSPVALIFGGVLILSVLGLILTSRKPRRRTALIIGGALVLASAGMAVVMFIAFRGNPSSLMFGMMMLLSTGAMTVNSLRRVRRDEDEVKR